MKQRGRKSEAAKEVEAVKQGGVAQRLDPPPDMTSDQKVVWYNVVDSQPPGWFNSSHYGELASYCEHTSYARSLARAMNELDTSTEAGQAQLCKLTVAHVAHTKAANAFFRSMRLTHQAKYDPKTAFRATDNTAERLPWESH